jgi:hypothetical protein
MTTSMSGLHCSPFETEKHYIGRRCGEFSLTIFIHLAAGRADVSRHLKPGGYIEFQELDYWPRCDDETLTDETPYAFRDFLNFLNDGMRNFGADIYAVRSLPDELKSAGFDDVELTTHKCPLGLWPRDKRLRLCGLFLRTAFMDGLRGASRRPLTTLGWTQLQIEMFLVDVRKAIMDPDIHAYLTFNVVYGRKPVT